LERIGFHRKAEDGSIDDRVRSLVVTSGHPGILFGKHKGTLITDLPGNYLNWFAREGFPQGKIGRLLALMQEMDHNGLRPLLNPLRKPKA